MTDHMIAHEFNENAQWSSDDNDQDHIPDQQPADLFDQQHDSDEEF